MPAQPQWLYRLPEIVEDIAALDLPVLDRAVFERVFRVKRRRAIYLLASFGGYQAGRTYLVDREALLRQLRGLASGDRFGYERQRREHLSARLERLQKDRRAASVRIPAPQPSAALPGLPSGVSFHPGRLVVEFRSVPELLGKLYDLARAAAGDFAAFEEAASPAAPNSA